MIVVCDGDLIVGFWTFCGMLDEKKNAKVLRIYKWNDTSGYIEKREHMPGNILFHT